MKIGTLIAVVFLASAGVASADVHLVQRVDFTWKFGENVSSVARHELWLSESRARLEQEQNLYLLDIEEKAFVYANQEEDHYHLRVSPNTLESQFPPTILSQVRPQWKEGEPTTVRFRRTGKTERVAGYDTELVIIEAGGPDEPLTARFEWWVSEALDKQLRSTAYGALFRDRMWMTPMTSWLVDLLGEHPPYPVRSKVTMSLSRGRMKTEYTTTLVSVEESVEPPAGHYEVPPGYELQPNHDIVSPR